MIWNYLYGRAGHMLERGLEVRFPHVHGHRLDLIQLLQNELAIISFKALRFAFFRHVFHCAADQVANMVMQS